MILPRFWIPQVWMALTASATLKVLVSTMGLWRYPDSSIQMTPVNSPQPFRLYQAAKTGRISPPQGKIAVTPVRTGPAPTCSFPFPEISVSCPTVTPFTSVMAFHAPGVPEKGMPKSLALGRWVINCLLMVFGGKNEFARQIVIRIIRTGVVPLTDCKKPF